MVNKLPVGKMARTSVAGVTAAKIGAKKLSLLSKKPFLSKESFKKQQTESDDEIAEVLFSGLTKLRGSALKVAQIMSLELGVLPDAYRKELYKSHYQVPPLNRALIRKLMLNEFKLPPEEVFAEFNGEAFAAASLGQVHQAKAKDGRKLAVKVQYPGVDSALKNDLQLVKQFMLPFFKTEYLTNAMRELDQRLSEEVDYELERKNTQWFHDHAQIKGVVIPKTFAEFSTKKVLTTEFIEGMHIDKWMQTNPSQQERDQVAQVIYDLCMHSFFELQKLHADPNPGNYLFLGDGRIALIDFGSVKSFDPKFTALISELWSAHISGDRETLLKGYCSLGLGRGDPIRAKAFYDSHLRGFSEWLETPFREGTFDFGKNPEYCLQATKLIQKMLALKEMDGFTTETILFDRNLYGLYRVFTELGARVQMRNKWIKLKR